MADTLTDANALHAAHIACSHCGEDLYRIDHSPLYGDSLLYCDQCANRVELSIADPVVTALAAEIAPPAAPAAREALWRAVEDRLLPCACGGRYRHDAARRCHVCLTEVLGGAPEVDLWPGFVDLGDTDEEPAEDIAARINAFDAAHIRRRDLWHD